MLEKILYDTLREKEAKFQEYLTEYNWIFYDESLYRLSRKGRRNKIWLNCYFYFKENSSKILNIFIKRAYADLENAMENTKDINELFQEFVNWFDKERKEFRMGMEIDIEKCKETIIQNRKTPQSHGGVANLLKVLTKTMEQKGSDISNIAKVQYAICVQAGIYLPDEFIEDVAVALDIQGKYKS